MVDIARARHIREASLLKGWAITLVVFGHLPFMEGAESYVLIRKIIYGFHMPLFMAVAGYLYGAFTKHRITSVRSYGEYVVKKAARFIPAYAFTAALLFAVKIGASRLVDLKNPVELRSLMMMFINPLDGFVVHLWFIYALFIILVLYPVLAYALRPISPPFRILLYFSLSLVPTTSTLCIDEVFRYLMYFHLGDLASGQLLDGFKRKNALPTAISAVLLAAASVVLCFVDTSGRVFTGASYITAICGTALCALLSIRAARLAGRVMNLFYILGLYSFEIYLFHTLGSETVALVLKKVMGTGASFHLLNAVLGTVCGLVVPIVFAEILVRLAQPFAKIILGRSSRFSVATTGSARTV